jgi:hypothetical protein
MFNYELLFEPIIESNGELIGEGAEQLARLFEANVTSLRRLNIESCELADEGVCTALSPFQSPRNVLEELNLVQNEIEAAGANFLVRLPLYKLKKLSLEDNMDIPKKHLKQRYGDKVTFDEDDDDEDEEASDDDCGMDDLVQQMSNARV